MTLDQVPRGKRVQVVAITDEPVRLTALRLGLIPGSWLTVLENLPGGPVVVCQNRQEIALGRSLARSLLVEKNHRRDKENDRTNWGGSPETRPRAAKPSPEEVSTATDRPAGPERFKLPAVTLSQVGRGSSCFGCRKARAAACPFSWNPHPRGKEPRLVQPSAGMNRAEAPPCRQKEAAVIPTKRGGGMSGEGYPPTLALAGNPNVGKSVIFNYLTGLYVNVSNYPGTTVEVAWGCFGPYTVVDSPGIYGISSFSDEERVAREALLTADLILNVVDATHLERDLFLTLQLLDMGKPMLVALNLFDEAQRLGLKIDVPLLSRLLGVPVVPTVAVKGRGLEELKSRIGEARGGQPDPVLQRELSIYRSLTGSPAEAWQWVEEGGLPPSRLSGLPENCPGVRTYRREMLYQRRRERLEEIVASVLRVPATPIPAWFRLNRMVLNPLTGFPILVLVLFLVFYLFGVLVAQGLVGITEGVIMKDYYVPFLKRTVTGLLEADSLLDQVLVGEFGLLTMAVTYLLGLLLPLVFGFSLALSLLEDSGYLPRIAVLLDGPMTRWGLNGRAIIPFTLGLGCVTMAMLTTRVLTTRRERRIAIVLLSLAIPCSAQLGVVTGLLSRISGGIALLYVLILGGVLSVMGTLLQRLLPGQSSALLLDLPPLRWPQWSNVLRKSALRAGAFLHEAGPLFVYSALVLTLLQVTGYLAQLERWLNPLTVDWLRLPPGATRSFILGFVRRDFGAAGLYALSLTDWQTLVAAVTITLFVPCIASVTVIFKEQGAGEGVALWLLNLFVAFLIGGLVARWPFSGVSIPF
ncbi:MAG: ferrous iron transport protein B [Firmicutes bacterium]|nr:ferrous iron transport protein B [Bacillota bacterium]MCL5038816.1 ferrous iron transport protein B [Bacillota bacterium]